MDVPRNADLNMEQEDVTERDLTLTVLLPEGHERTVTVHGSKPVMDVLVILCARYHLNPSDHVMELFSTNRNKLQFKPSSLIGSLEAEHVVLKPKRSDSRKAPNMPVATVRLLINYRKSHKAVVRVSPSVPLAELMSAVCNKCEMDPQTAVLLRDRQSEEPLDLNKTLNDYGIREVYARDVSSSPTDPPTPTHKDYKKDKLVMQDKVVGEKENRGLLGMFRRSKKSSEETPTSADTISATSSLVLKDQHVNKAGRSEASSASTPGATDEMPKKRRAPQPPSRLGSQSVSQGELKLGQQARLASNDDQKPGVLCCISSTDSSLKRNKRRAPPPPCTSPSLTDADKGFYLKDDEVDWSSVQACLDQSSVFKPAWLSSSSSSSSLSSSPLMNEVLSEFIDRMKTKQMNDASFDGSVTCSPPASSLPLVSGSLESGPLVPPGCELLRRGPQTEGLTTFTVVPRRRPQSIREYEVLLTLETMEMINGDEEETLDSEQDASREMKMGPKEMLEESDDDYENVEEVLGMTGAFGALNLSMVAEEHHHPEDRDGGRLEEEDERGWIEVFRERRRRFLSDDDDDDDDGNGVKLKTSTKASEEQIMDDVPPLPQRPVCWAEEHTKTQNREEMGKFKKEEAEEDKAVNVSVIQNPDPSRCEPTSDSTNIQDPCRDVNLSSNLHSSSPSTSSQSNLHNHQPTPPQSPLPDASESKLDPGSELSSHSASPFALAVSQRVQSLGNGIIPSAGKIKKPQTPRPQSVGSQRASSKKKIYFQNLIPQEFVSNIPASLGPCDEAPPISTAPLSVVMKP